MNLEFETINNIFYEIIVYNWKQGSAFENKRNYTEKFSFNNL